ncbi:MAG: hypothetical protein R3C44_19875 [Chloroflexota bacterium]
MEYCHIGLAGETPEGAVISGSVLDASALEAVTRELVQLRPDIEWDLTAVTVLRSQPAHLAAVFTNMTGFFREPSWLAEQQSQVLNGLLLEILKEEGRWAFVRLNDGYLGWVYQTYLGAADQAQDATHIVGVPVSYLHATPSEAAPLAGRVFAGTAVRATVHHDGWAELHLTGGLCGYVPATDLRDPAENLPEDALRTRLVSDAQALIGVPYLWGGVTAQELTAPASPN